MQNKGLYFSQRISSGLTVAFLNWWVFNNKSAFANIGLTGCIYFSGQRGPWHKLQAVAVAHPLLSSEEAPFGLAWRTLHVHHSGSLFRTYMFMYLDTHTHTEAVYNMEDIKMIEDYRGLASLPDWHRLSRRFSASQSPSSRRSPPSWSRGGICFFLHLILKKEWLTLSQTKQINSILDNNQDWKISSW